MSKLSACCIISETMFASYVFPDKNRLYRYVTRTNVSFFDPSPNDQRTEHSCA